MGMFRWAPGPVRWHGRPYRLRVSQTRFRTALLLVLALFLTGTAAMAASSPASPGTASRSKPSSAASPKPTAQTAPNPGVAEEKPAIPEGDIISFLNATISWYRHLDVEQTLATEPAEMLYFADDRDMAQKALNLAFDFAHAAASLLQNTAPPAAPTGTAGTPTSSANGMPIVVVGDLPAKLAQAQADLRASQARVTDLQAQSRRAAGARRRALADQVAAAQSQLRLAQLRVDSLQAVTNFEAGTGAGGQISAGGLQGQIDELARSIPLPSQGAKPSTASNARTEARQTEPIAASGIIGNAENLLALTRKQQALDSTIDLTNSLNASVNKLRAPLVAAARRIDSQATALASQVNGANPADLEQVKTRLEHLASLYKLNVNALMPLTRMSGELAMYRASLDRWRKLVNTQSAASLRALAAGLGGLVIILAVVGLGAVLWRRIIFRYVHDRQHRQQLLQIRRIVVTVVIALVLVFDFANQFGALATILGFAAAGIALALQNVIMSMAGYLYVSGRYGIRVGDRIQISGINGDVLEIGLFKLTMLELSGDANGQQPTGRVVIFPNSVVFQTTGNFFRQIPGTNLTWNELKISLAPDCDYRLVEKRLLEIVGEVYSRYREAVQREYYNMERNLNIRAEPPKPMSRLQFSETAIELIVRYPVRIDSTAETQDEVARRVVDALRKEPGLKLNVQGTPNVERASPPKSQSESAATPPDGASES
jgi:small-conductance mechanosensitive channel